MNAGGVAGYVPTSMWLPSGSRKKSLADLAVRNLILPVRHPMGQQRLLGRVEIVGVQGQMIIARADCALDGPNLCGTSSTR